MTTVALAGSAISLGWRVGTDLPRAVTSFLVSSSLSALGFGLVGALIISRRPRQPIGWLCCVAGVGSGLQALTPQLSANALVYGQAVAQGGELAAWLSRWVFLPGLALPTILLLLLFPTGRPLSERWRIVVAVAVSCVALYTALLAFNPEPIFGLANPQNPFGIDAMRPLMRPALTAAATLTALVVAAAASSVVLRFRRAHGDERQQLKWLAYGAAVFAVVLSIRPIIGLLGRASSETELFGRSLEALALQLIPISAGIA